MILAIEAMAYTESQNDQIINFYYFFNDISQPSPTFWLNGYCFFLFASSDRNFPKSVSFDCWFRPM